MRTRPNSKRSTRRAKVKLGSFSIFLDIGFFEDGQPAEIFITVSREGTLLRTTMDMVARLVSLNLQHGVPIPTIVSLMKGIQCEPASTEYSSVFDFIAKELEHWSKTGKDEDNKVRSVWSIPHEA